MADKTAVIDFEGSSVPFREQDTVAAALMRSGVLTLSRGPKYHRPRGAFCLTGTCAQCHVRVDGEPNVPACMTPASAGQKIERQNALGSVDNDLLRAVDFIFRDKLDHHHLMTRFKGLSVATQLVARRLAGVGEKPSRPMSRLAAGKLSVDVVVIGAGRSGLAAARRETTGRVLVLEQRSRAGGRALDGLGTIPSATLPPHAALKLSTQAIGLFDEGGAHYVLAHQAEGLLRIETTRVVLATGGIERPLPFEANDLPGVVAGRGLLRLARTSGPVAGKRVVVLGLAPDAPLVVRGLIEAGYEVSLVDPEGRFTGESGLVILQGAQPVRALGRSRVTGLRIQQADGEEHDLKCDLIAVVNPLAPAYELGAQVGAQARYDGARGGFVLDVDGEGRTTVPWVSAVGRIAGSLTPG